MSRPDVGTEPTLPHNLEAERGVIGAILLHNDSYEIVNGIIGAGDFYRVGHRFIYAALDALLEWKDGSADLTLLIEQLNKHGQLDEAGGPAYITSLVDGVPRQSNVRHHAEVVKEKARLRGLIFAANKMLSSAYAAEEPAALILQQADHALVDLQTDTAGRMLTLRDSSKDLLDNLEWRHAHKGEITGVDTGFESINALTLGFQPGELIIIAARPSVGKTTWAMNHAVAAAKTGKRIAVFSFEMRRQQLEYRMLSALSGVPLSRILSGYFMEADWGPLSHAAGILHTLPIAIDDKSGQTVWDMRTACRRMKAEDGLDELIVDYAQLIPGTLDRKGATRNDEMTHISRSLKTTADELGIPIVLLSQLSRAAKDRADPRPKLTDLRESGALEQDCDIAGFLHRKDHRAGGITHFIIEKQRNGPCGTVALSLDRDILLFTEVKEEPAEAEPQPKAQPRRRPRRG